MQRPWKPARVAAAALAVCLSGLAGCSKKMTISQVPEFYTPELKTIAVVPFRNQSGWKAAGQIVSDKFAAALMANGAYRVFNRNDLRTVMDQQDLQIALGDDSAAAASTFKKLTEVQAILTGTVTTYATTSNRQQRRDPIYGMNRQGQSYIQGYRTYVHTRNEANVSVTASLIRVADGTTIHATPSPAWARVWAQGSPPKKDPYACAAEATDSVVYQLLTQFAPIRRQIEIDPDKALRTASELYDNKWTYTDRFKSTDEKMFVVAALPAACDRNRFRLAVVRKDQRKDLASQDIVWSKKYKGYGYVFSPKQIAQAGGGPGEYEVKFYCGPEPIMRRSFKID